MSWQFLICGNIIMKQQQQRKVGRIAAAAAEEEVLGTFEVETAEAAN